MGVLRGWEGHCTGSLSSEMSLPATLGFSSHHTEVAPWGWGQPPSPQQQHTRDMLLPGISQHTFPILSWEIRRLRKGNGLPWVLPARGDEDAGAGSPLGVAWPPFLSPSWRPGQECGGGEGTQQAPWGPHALPPSDEPWVASSHHSHRCRSGLGLRSLDQGEVAGR